MLDDVAEKFMFAFAMTWAGFVMLNVIIDMLFG